MNCEQEGRNRYIRVKKFFVDDGLTVVCTVWISRRGSQKNANIKLVNQPFFYTFPRKKRNFRKNRIKDLERHEQPELQLEALRALKKVAAAAGGNARVLIELGAVQKLVQLLTSCRDRVRVLAVWALGNIAGDSCNCRNRVLSHGVLETLVSQLNENTSLSVLRIVSWALALFCQGEPPLPLKQANVALLLLRYLFRLDDEEILTGACAALDHLSLSYSPNNVDVIINAGICPQLSQLLLHHLPSVIYHALGTICNIVAGDDDQTQVVLNYVLPCLHQLLTQNHKEDIEEDIKERICCLLSNIMARNMTQIQAVIGAGLVLPLVQLLLQDEKFNIKIGAASAISNATTKASHDQIRFLVSQGCIKALSDPLSCRDAELVNVCREGLENIWKAGKVDTCLNIYTQMFDECLGINQIDNVETNDNLPKAPSSVKSKRPKREAQLETTSLPKKIKTASTSSEAEYPAKQQARIRIGPDFQAEVPYWTGMVAESDSKWLGTQIWPLEQRDNMCCDPIGKGRGGSLESELGPAYYSWNFDKMGEAYACSMSWTPDEEEVFEREVKNTLDTRKSMWEMMRVALPKKSWTDLVSYYWNVFVLRRRAFQNGLTPSNIDSDDNATPDRGYLRSRRRR